MKNFTFLYLLLLLSININAQELTCKDFKIGQFYIPETEEKAKYTIIANDSISEISPERDKTIKKYIVLRKKNTQIEWKNGIGNGKPIYEIIEWIDDCTYRLTYDATKSELDESEKWINDNNGIVISKTKIENKCLFYAATMTTVDKQKITQNGIICKE